MKRKPIYMLRMVVENGMQVTGQITVYATRVEVARLVRQLRRIGIEASPKQPESHR